MSMVTGCRISLFSEASSGSEYQVVPSQMRCSWGRVIPSSPGEINPRTVWTFPLSSDRFMFFLLPCLVSSHYTLLILCFAPP